MESITFKGHKIVGGKVEGVALKTNENVCFLGCIDPVTGVVTEIEHELSGEVVTDKILVYPTGKGSTGGAYRLYEMSYRGTAPKAIINLKADPITTIGAIMGKIPLIDRVDTHFFEKINTGDYITIDGDEGRITVKKSNA